MPADPGRDTEWARRLVEHFRAAAPIDERERESIDEFCDVVPGLVAPFNEHVDVRHVTASAIVMGERGVVMHLHKRLGLWLQPGGHVDTDESPDDAAVRESQEELGMMVRHPSKGPQLVHVDVHPGPRGHRHYDVRYLLLAGDEDPSPPVGESPHARWFSFDEACAVADPGLHGGLVAALRTYVRYRD
jgi:8-oxo-dGTP pyrophosphatase MutT (NUDIX family)